ncbi:MAG: ABC transporter permease, partial [Eubacterium sp.]|nr:ABC transporter permease [Eubacterium sp.]
ECNINIFIEEYTDYYRLLASNVFDQNEEVFEEKHNEVMTAEEYINLTMKDFSDYYTTVKSQVGYEKDFISATLLAIDDRKLETLENHLVSGAINLDKLASGEEIILVAPQKAAYKVEQMKNYVTYSTAFDDDIIDGYDYDLYGECEYKAGDTINISLLFGNPDDSIYGDMEEKADSSYDLKRMDKKVKIGAVISPNYFSKSDSEQWMAMGMNFGAITSISGMNKFAPKEKYHAIFMNVDGEITDEIDETITNTVDSILYKYDMSVRSEYQSTKDSAKSNNSMIVAMVSLIIIGFTICASLTNNAFTANIRERKRELGTLRAVGISRKEFVESYVRQLLKTFGLGYGLGFGIFVAGYLICRVIVYIKNLQPENMAVPSEVGIDFNPWVTIAFCIVLFGICSLNLWAKIRKEMKNSIIDNIREL